MNYSSVQIVLQEVPNEISLCFSICGCVLKCKGCHSPFLWKESNGAILDEIIFKYYLQKYDGLISCVLFMGGEWHEDELTGHFKTAKKFGLKTCLYTGSNAISDELKKELTYLKTGPWIQERGGLTSKTTNQLFIEVETNKNLNHLFNTKNYDKINCTAN